ncbi:exlusion protein FxsA [Solibacillus sp. R5-41]|uniref:FxsA family protein n=1 Tax=Solibacillus sp. R5-41 TaxID=2048654 RepID=UPI000C124B58|nr:FxsA family protein [Solibacillus sp. R5-41]ATP41432.1 exlusion protein FxsA [Solibacillus sp. R5-41]
MKKLLVGLLFIVFAEIATLIIVGKAIGVLYTLLLIVMTSVVGVIIAKKRGIKSFQEIQKSAAQGQPPGLPMIETFLIFIGGVLLALPGFLTDIIGLLFVLGITRSLFKPLIFYWLRKKMKQGQVVILQK